MEVILVFLFLLIVFGIYVVKSGVIEILLWILLGILGIFGFKYAKQEFDNKDPIEAAGWVFSTIFHGVLIFCAVAVLSSLRSCF